MIQHKLSRLCFRTVGLRDPLTTQIDIQLYDRTVSVASDITITILYWYRLLCHGVNTITACESVCVMTSCPVQCCRWEPAIGLTYSRADPKSVGWPSQPFINLSFPLTSRLDYCNAISFTERLPHHCYIAVTEDWILVITVPGRMGSSFLYVAPPIMAATL